MRKLAIVCCSFSAAVFLAVYLLPFRFVLLTAGLLGALGIFVLLTKRLWLRPYALALLGAALGLSWFFLRDLQTVVPARLLNDSTREITARVLEYPEEYDSYCRLTARIENEELPRVNALVYDTRKRLLSACPGDTLRFEARLSGAEELFGEQSRRYHARDIYCKLYVLSEPMLVEKAPPGAQLPVRIRQALLTRLEEIFPADVTAFMKSLLLGDKSELYRDEELYLALSRAGNMHALAVSGLHIAYLIGMVQLVLGRGRLSSLLCIPLVWFFVLVTGGSPSAVRAAVMQSLLLLAPLLRRENDPPTSLSFALTLILLQNPRAAADVGLQLSFAAMAGILCFGEGLGNSLVSHLAKGRIGKHLRKPAAALAAALAVLPFTVPLLALHFGYVSLAAPISAVLCYLAISLCFCLGYTACLCSLLCMPLGIEIARIAAWLARYLALVSRLIARAPFSVVYTEFRWFLPWLVLVYLLFAVFHFLPLRRGERLLLPALLALLTLMLLTTTERIRYERDAYFSVLDVGQGQCLCAMYGGGTVLIDCGNRMAAENAGELAGRFLLARGRESVDALILTHFDTDHLNGVSMLMHMLPVRRLILPADAPDETGGLAGILKLAARKKIPVEVLEKDAVLRCGRLRIELFAPLTHGESNESGLFALLHFLRYDVIVTGDASADTERRFLLHALPLDSELLIAGHHGAQGSSAGELLSLSGADTAIISVGFNTYGQPAPETLARLDENGYTVFRSDRDGTVTLHIEESYGKKERKRRSKAQFRGGGSRLEGARAGTLIPSLGAGGLSA